MSIHVVLLSGCMQRLVLVKAFILLHFTSILFIHQRSSLNCLGNLPQVCGSPIQFLRVCRPFHMSFNLRVQVWNIRCSVKCLNENFLSIWQRFVSIQSQKGAGGKGISQVMMCCEQHVGNLVGQSQNSECEVSSWVLYYLCGIFDPKSVFCFVNPQSFD